MTHNTSTPVADKALAERLARLLGGEHEAEADGDYDTADLDQACGNAFRARQLITLAEAQAMVAAERERCAVIADYAGVKQMPSDGSYSHHEPVMGPDVAAAIRAAATGTKEGDDEI